MASSSIKACCTGCISSSLANPFDGAYARAVGARRRRQTGQRGDAVEPDRARAALALFTSRLCARQAQVVAQHPQQGLAVRALHKTFSPLTDDWIGSSPSAWCAIVGPQSRGQLPCLAPELTIRSGSGSPKRGSPSRRASSPRRTSASTSSLRNHAEPRTSSMGRASRAACVAASSMRVLVSGPPISAASASGARMIVGATLPSAMRAPVTIHRRPSSRRWPRWSPRSPECVAARV